MRKPAFLCAMIIGLSPALTWAASPASEAEKNLKQAVSQVDTGNWPAAVESFEAAQATGAPLPESFAYHYGRALAKAKRYVEARVVLEGYLAAQGAGARFAKQAQELLAEVRKQTGAHVREAVKAADVAMAATIKEREAQAEQAYKDGRFADALGQYQVLADQGSVIAYRRLGELYLNGKGAPRNAVEAARWFRRAAEKDDFPATAELGGMYQRGEGVLPDWKEAHRLLKKAAEAGDAYAMREFAFMVLDGRGQPASIQEALRWYGKAAEAGQPEAANMAGTINEYYLRPPTSEKRCAGTNAAPRMGKPRRCTRCRRFTATGAAFRRTKPLNKPGWTRRSPPVRALPTRKWRGAP